MTTDWQTWAALFVVVVAAALLVRSMLNKRKSPGCSGGCPTDDFKKQLARRDITRNAD